MIFFLIFIILSHDDNHFDNFFLFILKSISTATTLHVHILILIKIRSPDRIIISHIWEFWVFYFFFLCLCSVSPWEKASRLLCVLKTILYLSPETKWRIILNLMKAFDTRKKIQLNDENQNILCVLCNLLILKNSFVFSFALPCVCYWKM